MLFTQIRFEEGVLWSMWGEEGKILFLDVCGLERRGYLLGSWKKNGSGVVRGQVLEFYKDDSLVQEG